MNIEMNEAQILDVIDYAAIDEEQLRLDYSGRAMYGAKCVGIVGDMGDAMRFVLAVAQVVDREMAEFLTRDVRSDSMGLSNIYYWPGLQVER